MTLIDVAVGNPFVGPRSIQAGQPLFGRDREQRDLLDSILAHRIVLLYSPSGAGKTSLLQAGLAGALEAEDVAVPRRPPPFGEPASAAPPVLIRVGLQASAVEANTNRYVASTVKALDAALPASDRVDDRALRSLDLHDHLDDWHRRHFGGGDVCLIFDQFEELLVDQADEAAKREFLFHLGAFLGDQRPWPGDATASALGSSARSRHRFAVFAMREDFLAQLDPHLALLPTGLRTRYRLNLLTAEAARTAIQRPTGDRLEFDDAAATKLVEDLSRVHVTRDGHVEEHAGRHVEPVQLQVVCRQLWERHRAAGIAGPVVVDEVAQLGSVDAALADFYDEQVADAAGAAGSAERDVREWFNALITDRGLRAPVSALPKGDDDGRAVAALLDGHIIRREDTKGTSWFELSHDRLVEPVRTSNGRWFEDNLSLVESAARVWDQSSRPESLLLHDDVLRTGRSWAAEHPDLLGDVERQFLEQSDELQTRIDRERRSGTRLRVATLVAVVVGLVAIAGLGYAERQRRQSERAEREAERAQAAFLWTDFSVGAATPRQALLGALAAWTPEIEPPKLVRDQVVDALTWARSVLTYSAAAAISPDGRELAVASGIDGIRVFSVDDQQQLRSLPLRVVAADVMYSADGESLAVAHVTADGVRVMILDASSGVEQAVLEAPGVDADRLLLTWSRDRSTLGVMDGENDVVVWDVDTGRLLGRDDGSAAGISDDGQQIAVVDGTSLDVLDRDGDVTQSFTDERGFTALAPVFTLDGSFIVAPLNDGNVNVFDLAAGTVVETTSTFGSAIMGQGVATDGTVAWLGSDCWVERMVPPAEVIEPVQLSCAQQVATGSPFSADGRRAMGATADGGFKVWDLATGEELFSHSTVPSAAAVGDDRVVIATNGWVTVRSGDGRFEREANLTSDAISRIAASSGDGPVAVAADEEVLIFDAELDDSVATLPVATDGLYDMSVSQDGDLLALILADSVELWNLPADERIVHVPDGDSLATTVEISPDGTFMAVGRSDGTVQIIGTADGMPEAESTLPPPSTSFRTPARGSSVEALAVGTDGRVAFGDISGQVFTWDRDPTRQPEKIGDLGDAAISVDVDRGSVAAVARTVVKAWTLDGDAPVLEHRQSDNAPSFSHVAIADGDRVTTLALDGVISQHHLEWQELWEDARTFADSQGWEALTNGDCEEVSHEGCASPPGS